jgi:hypothetical protein
MNSIYHITFASVTDYLGRGLQIDTCLSNNVNVKILDISPMLNLSNPEHSDKYSSLVVKINKIEELEEHIQKTSPERVILNLQVPYEWRFRKLFRLISRLDDNHFSVFLLGHLPFHSNRSLLAKILSTSPHKIPYRITTALLGRLFFKIKYFSLPKNAFYAGELLAQTSQYKKLFPINYLDYDACLNNSQISDEKYIVFLDDAIFIHPDNKIVGTIITESMIQAYQKSINNLFDFIEETTKLKIIIASHPKANYQENFFKSRIIIKQNTQELVRKCSFTLCHCSSSVSFPVCYKKPIVFITDQTIIDLSKKYEKLDEYIHNFAKHLGSFILNASEELLPLTKENLQIDINKYDKFKLNYLTTNETKQKATEHFILGYFEQILKSRNT